MVSYFFNWLNIRLSIQNKKIFLFIYLIMLLSASSELNAQFLPAGQIKTTHLTQEVLSRWIDTNNQIQKYQVLIDSLLPTDAEAKAFDKLTTPEQDNLVNNYLKKTNQFEPINGLMHSLGWTGVADYMRVSSQIGNALAADILSEKMRGLSPEAKKAVWEHADVAVKNVSPEDLAFIRANMNRLKKHIQGYGKSN